MLNYNSRYLNIIVIAIIIYLFYQQKTFHNMLDSNLKPTFGKSSHYTIQFDKDKKMENMSYLEKMTYSLLGKKYQLDDSKQNGIIPKPELNDIVVFDVIRKFLKNKSINNEEIYGPPLSPIRIYTTLGANNIDAELEKKILESNLGGVFDISINGALYQIQIIDIKKIRKNLY